VVLSGPKGPVRGVIGKQAIHLMKKEDMDKVSKITDLWIDVGATTRTEALERVRLGDPAVLDAGVRELPNRRIVSRAIDNRIGAYVVAEVVRLLAKDRPQHAGVFAVATTREEIAWTGGGARTSAVGIDPQVAVVVDVTHATDYPGAEKKRANSRMSLAAISDLSSASTSDSRAIRSRTAWGDCPLSADTSKKLVAPGMPNKSSTAVLGRKMKLVIQDAVPAERPTIRNFRSITSTRSPMPNPCRSPSTRSNTISRSLRGSRPSTISHGPPPRSLEYPTR